MVEGRKWLNAPEVFLIEGLRFSTVLTVATVIGLPGLSRMEASVQANARLHLPEDKRNVIYDQFQVAHSLLFDEE